MFSFKIYLLHDSLKGISASRRQHAFNLVMSYDEFQTYADFYYRQKRILLALDLSYEDSINDTVSYLCLDLKKQMNSKYLIILSNELDYP